MAKKEDIQQIENVLNDRSDRDAVGAFKNFLKANNFEEKKWDGEGICPADIYVTHRETGQDYFFEMKKTTKKDNSYFGGASLPEWEAAVNNEGYYFFVIAFLRADNDYDFYIISPKDFYKFTYIPSFKIYFNIPFKEENGKKKFFTPGRKKESVILKDDILKILSSQWEEIKNCNHHDKMKKEESSDLYLLDQETDCLCQINKYLSK